MSISISAATSISSSPIGEARYSPRRRSQTVPKHTFADSGQCTGGDQLRQCRRCSTASGAFSPDPKPRNEAVKRFWTMAIRRQTARGSTDGRRVDATHLYRTLSIQGHLQLERGFKQDGFSRCRRGLPRERGRIGRIWTPGLPLGCIIGQSRAHCSNAPSSKSWRPSDSPNEVDELTPVRPGYITTPTSGRGCAPLSPVGVECR